MAREKVRRNKAVAAHLSDNYLAFFKDFITGILSAVGKL
jgi:hypothetical protein